MFPPEHTANVLLDLSYDCHIVTLGFLYQQTSRQESVTILEVIISGRYIWHSNASLGTPLPILKANEEV